MPDNSKQIQPDTGLKIPMPDVVRFVRQLSHDLRNHLNAAELQSAYINEIAPDAELKGEVKRLRGMLSEMGGSLQRLTSSLAPVKLTEMSYEASSFAEDLQQKIKTQFPEESEAIDWQVNTGRAALEIDPQVLQQAFIELFANAFRHARGPGQLQARVGLDKNEFVFNLQESKTSFEGSPENWGREPFRKVGHGHYGLGLHRARTIIETHGGRFNVRYDPASSSLVTTVGLPIGTPA